MLRERIHSGWPYLAALGTLLFLLLFSERQLERRHEAAVSGTLSAVLGSTQEALSNWVSLQKTNVNSITQLPDIRNSALALLRANSRGERERFRANLRERLGPLVTSHGYLGYSIIDLSGVRVGALRTINRGSMNFISRSVPDLFARVVEGETLVTLPMKWDVPLIDPSGQVREQVATMFALAPVRTASGEIRGVLALRINPLQDFSAIFSRGRTGQSGETYSFDSSGQMLSESRFTDNLREIGLLAAGELSTLNIAIKYPGRNLLEQRGVFGRQSWPLTKMAMSATEGYSGMSLVPYPDYRGVPVIGVWTWDGELGLGITTEIDAEEAYDSLDTSKSAVRFMAFFAVMLLVALFIIQLKSHRLADKQQRALAIAKDKAEAANKAKMKFLSAMSHDLRTPLNAVIGFSQLLSEGIANKEDHKTYLGHIARSGAHLLRLLNEVLEFAKLDIGELSFSVEKCPAKLIVDDSVVMVRDLAENNRISLHVDSDFSDLPMIWADCTRACQVLVNLLTNAIKYNRVEGAVFITVNRDGNELQFAVRDTGTGIPRQKLKSLWEPFNRIGAEKTSIEGSGIGLAFAKALVEGQSGRIGVESTEGVGSCFWFTLPIAEEAAVANAPVQKVSEPELNLLRKRLENSHVLLVEEAPLDKIIIAEMLGNIPGLELTHATTGKAGLSALKEQNFDLVLVDLSLPDMDGFEWNQRRDRFGLAFDTPLIALSADVTDETKQRAIMAGYTNFLEKPVLLETLIMLAARALTIADKGRAQKTGS